MQITTLTTQNINEKDYPVLREILIILAVDEGLSKNIHFTDCYEEGTIIISFSNEFLSSLNKISKELNSDFNNTHSKCLENWEFPYLEVLNDFIALIENSDNEITVNYYEY